MLKFRNCLCTRRFIPNIAWRQTRAERDLQEIKELLRLAFAPSAAAAAPSAGVASLASACQGLCSNSNPALCSIGTSGVPVGNSGAPRKLSAAGRFWAGGSGAPAGGPDGNGGRNDGSSTGPAAPSPSDSGTELPVRAQSPALLSLPSPYTHGQRAANRGGGEAKAGGGDIGACEDGKDRDAAAACRGGFQRPSLDRVAGPGSPVRSCHRPAGTEPDAASLGGRPADPSCAGSGAGGHGGSGSGSPCHAFSSFGSLFSGPESEPPDLMEPMAASSPAQSVGGGGGGDGTPVVASARPSAPAAPGPCTMRMAPWGGDLEDARDLLPTLESYGSGRPSTCDSTNVGPFGTGGPGSIYAGTCAPDEMRTRGGRGAKRARRPRTPDAALPAAAGQAQAPAPSYSSHRTATTTFSAGAKKRGAGLGSAPPRRAGACGLPRPGGAGRGPARTLDRRHQHCRPGGGTRPDLDVRVLRR